MPLLEPNKTFTIWLNKDKDKPIDKRPTFVVKAQSLRTAADLLEEYDLFFNTEKAIGIRERMGRLIDVAFPLISSWADMNELPLTKDTLWDYFDVNELTEIVTKVAYNTPSHEEKKS